MIARVWRGVTTSKDADAYLTYLERTGLAAYQATPGNKATFAFRRVIQDRAEFVLLTLWTSAEAIREFAGADPDRAVFYPEDERFLIEKGERVDHFEVVFSSANP